MKSIVCALLSALFVQLAFAAPRTNKTMSDTVMMGRTMSVGDMDQFVVVFGVSPCMASCMSDMQQSFNSTDNDNSTSHQDNFDRICNNYFDAAECFKKCPDGDDHLFDVISSGAQFMCVDQRDAFEKALPCLRQQKKDMKKECNQKCQLPQGDNMDDDSTDSTDIPPQWNNSTALFSHIGGLCDVLHCSIECGRDYLNQHCDPSQHIGNLVTEVIIRPLEKNAEFLQQMSPDIDEAISQALPKSCGFIVDIDELNALRGGWVPPDMESTDMPNEVTNFPISSSSTIQPNFQSNQHRRRRSASNLVASSGAYASHAMGFFM